MAQDFDERQHWIIPGPPSSESDADDNADTTATHPLHFADFLDEPMPYLEPTMDDDSPVMEQPRPTVPLLQHHRLSEPLRVAYIMAAYEKVKGTSVLATDQKLRIILRAMSFAGNKDLETTYPRQYTTRSRTALCAINADPEEFMRRLVVCPNLACWSLFPYDELCQRDTPICGTTTHNEGRVSQCQEKIYTVQNHLRHPFKIMPLTPLATALELLLQDRCVRDNLQH